MMTKQQLQTRDRYALFIPITVLWMDNELYKPQLTAA
jgi:hypothetical protein